jgi:hypothetical protein
LEKAEFRSLGDVHAGSCVLHAHSWLVSAFSQCGRGIDQLVSKMPHASHGPGRFDSDPPEQSFLPLASQVSRRYFSGNEPTLIHTMHAHFFPFFFFFFLVLFCFAFLGWVLFCLGRSQCACVCTRIFWAPLSVPLLMQAAMHAVGKTNEDRCSLTP